MQHLDYSKVLSLVGLADLLDTTGHGLVDAALDMAEGYTGRYLLEQERTQTFHLPLGNRGVLLPAYPVKAVTKVTLDKAPITDYQADLPRGILVFPPCPDMALVEVTWTGGYPPDALPTAMLQAIALTAAALQEAVTHTGKTLTGLRIGGWQANYVQPGGTSGGLSAMCPAAAHLLHPYRAR